VTEDHERIDELLAGYVLLSLSGEDAAEADRILVDHVPSCPTCRANLSEFQAVAGEGLDTWQIAAGFEAGETGKAFADRNAALHAGAAHPHAPATGPVVAARVAVDPRRAAEFAHPDHRRILQETLLIQVGITSSEGLRSKRRYAVVVAFIIAAVLAPPDVVSPPPLEPRLDPIRPYPLDEPPDRRIAERRVCEEHVVPDKVHDLVGGRPRVPHAPQQSVGEAGADHLVVVEVPVGQRRRLPDVVQQRGQPHHRPVRRRGVDRSERVIPQILARDLVLGHAALGREIRRQHGEQSSVERQAEPDGRLGRSQEFPQLHPDPPA